MFLQGLVSAAMDILVDIDQKNSQPTLTDIIARANKMLIFQLKTMTAPV
jgi:hypothetical protein